MPTSRRVDARHGRAAKMTSAGSSLSGRLRPLPAGSIRRREKSTLPACRPVLAATVMVLAVALTPALVDANGEEPPSAGVALCMAVRALSSEAGAAVTRDGILGTLAGSALRNHSWAAAPCDDTPSPSWSTIDFDSQWLPATDTTVLSLPFLSGTGASSAGCQLRRKLLAVVADDTLVLTSFNMSVQFSCSLTGSLSGVSVSSVSVGGMLWRSVADVPALAAVDAPVAWSGNLLSTGSADVVISDADLFDGVAPAVLLAPSQVESTNELVEKVREDIDTARGSRRV
jgi:hypothetical protein